MLSVGCSKAYESASNLSTPTTSPQQIPICTNSKVYMFGNMISITEGFYKGSDLIVIGRCGFKYKKECKAYCYKVRTRLGTDDESTLLGDDSYE
jgi:hypothetical protein